MEQFVTPVLLEQREASQNEIEGARDINWSIS